MIPNLAEIKKILWETDEVFSFTIDTSTLNNGDYTFEPGQFNMLYTFGIGESAISISSDPAKRETITHTIHKVGNVTSALSQLKKGSVIGIRGPFGSSWPIEKARGRDVCIIAGGIGLAPIRPVIYSLLKRRKDYGKILLLYGARSPRDLLYRVELEQWNKKSNFEVHVTVDRGDSTWKGHIGVVTNLINYVKIDTTATVTMVCGPEVMMYYSLMEILKTGIPMENVYLSMERNMKCAVGFCGHCQYGPKFICKDGPVFNYADIKELFGKKEL
jgi:NAD(P)H-flavin reductase